MAQLRRERSRLDQLNTHVVVIGFVDDDDRTGNWLRETRSPFTLLVDDDRAVYRAYDMGHSATRTWSWSTLRYYARAVLSGERLCGIQGDPHQLGGDVIVDSAGIVRLHHASRTPTDRPPVDDLFAVLESLNGRDTPPG